ncbi:Sugar lactone lactonase YvrE [Mucilaginibacter gossypiicola]|uniref:Sugar lactone lactonase YvrE n=1 Tax=Mucilaginibacter gossypiicola TaxID=551995 RepID=A0A1H8NC39_9SPHI|nr:SMP-30/gluconolactonase/LRE family protein [Mucilaginibacter gossypiicola]SEO27174.1 Sugar lactone lactonase YvrE [Mucilaginibacter gossypiicola]
MSTDYTTLTAGLVYEAKAKLGEGAIWNIEKQCLYWVDIEGQTFNVFDPAKAVNRAYPTPKRIGTVVPVNAKLVLVALEDGIAALDLDSGAIRYQLNTDIHLSHNKRFNDGKCDPAGNFWVGTLSMDGVGEVSSLYCIKGDFSLEEKVTGVSISNGIAWSLDGNYMYYIDTPTGEVVQYNFDAANSNLSQRKVIVKIPESMGYPDGMTIDNEGMLWVALWDGFGVARFDPATGSLLQKIDVPAPKVTSCAFGSEGLDTLFITTASVEMTEEELRQYPLSGSVFAVKVDAKGIKAHHFKHDVELLNNGVS